MAFCIRMLKAGKHLIGMFVVVSFLLVPTCALSQEVVVVTNKSVPADSISKDEIKNIFLGNKTKWDDSTKIVFVTLKSASDNEAFLKEYVGKTPSQFKNYWKKQVFTGKGKQPKAFKSMEDLVDFVSKTEGAIGYITPNVPSGDTKPINVN